MSWRDCYAAAMLELDPAKCETKIETARATIHLRREELAKTNGGVSEEQQELSDALQNLRSLQRIELERSNRADDAKNPATAETRVAQYGSTL